MIDEVAKGKRSLLGGEFRCGGLGRYIAMQPGYEGVEGMAKVRPTNTWMV